MENISFLSVISYKWMQCWHMVIQVQTLNFVLNNKWVILWNITHNKNFSSQGTFRFTIMGCLHFVIKSWSWFCFNRSEKWSVNSSTSISIDSKWDLSVLVYFLNFAMSMMFSVNIVSSFSFNSPESPHCLHCLREQFIVVGLHWIIQLINLAYLDYL